MAILVRNLHGVLGGLNVRSNDTVDELKSKIEELEGIPAHKMRLIYAGKQLEDDSLLSDYHIQRECMVQLLLRLRGGATGRIDDMTEINLAAGGRIDQGIVKDPRRHRVGGGKPVFTWNTAKIMTFNVQILNSRSFTSITGLQAPATPVDAAEYAQLGFPFFSMPNEPETDVSGDFFGVSSVAQPEGVDDAVVNPTVKPLGWASTSNKSTSISASTAQPETSVYHTPVDTDLSMDFFNPDGPHASFRSVVDLEAELGKMSDVFGLMTNSRDLIF